jgi:hypothetical protein
MIKQKKEKLSLTAIVGEWPTSGLSRPASGEAYIPGMMDGEVVEEWKSRGPEPLQTFQLQ